MHRNAKMHRTKIIIIIIMLNNKNKIDKKGTKHAETCDNNKNQSKCSDGEIRDSE